MQIIATALTSSCLFPCSNKAHGDGWIDEGAADLAERADDRHENQPEAQFHGKGVVMISTLEPDGVTIPLSMCGRYPSHLPPELLARLFRTVNPSPNQERHGTWRRAWARP